MNVFPGVAGGDNIGTEGAGNGSGADGGAGGAAGAGDPTGKCARESPYVARDPSAPGYAFQMRASRCLDVLCSKILSSRICKQ